MVLPDGLKHGAKWDQGSIYFHGTKCRPVEAPFCELPLQYPIFANQ